MLYHTSAKPLPPCGKASFAAQETFSRGVIKSICLTVSPLRKARIFAFFSVTRSPSRLRTILAGKCLTLRIFLVDHTSHTRATVPSSTPRPPVSHAAPLHTSPGTPPQRSPHAPATPHTNVHFLTKKRLKDAMASFFFKKIW